MLIPYVQNRSLDFLRTSQGNNSATLYILTYLNILVIYLQIGAMILDMVRLKYLCVRCWPKIMKQILETIQTQENHCLLQWGLCAI